MKRNIVIVQCYSTGFNYVQDIIDRDYNPVVLEMKALQDNEASSAYLEEIRAGYKLIDNYFDMIYVKETYEPFMCARYIALGFICLLVLFFIGYVISSIVYFFIDSESPTSSALNYIGLMAPYCFIMCSLGYLVQMPERGF